MAAGTVLDPSPPEPLLTHLFEIYGKIFGLSQSAGDTGGWPGRAVRKS